MIYQSVDEFKNKWSLCSGWLTLACGCFDMLHKGHIHHLKEAKQKLKLNSPDKLFVLLTSDEFITKGPGRPVFSTQERAEILDSLKYVDGVIINHSDSALEAIEKLKPRIYFKGYDYANGKDEHGRLEKEKELVEKYNGRVIFTSKLEENPSSTQIVNKIHGNDNNEIFRTIRKNFTLEEIKRTISNSNKSFYVLGDNIRDVYQYVKINGIANKRASIACSLVEPTLNANGGAYVVYRHLKSFVNHIDLFLGDKETIKQRWLNVDNRQTLFEVVSDNAPEFKDPPLNIVLNHHNISDLVICDFGHGFFNAKKQDDLELWLEDQEVTPNLHLMVQANSLNYGFNTFHKWKKLGEKFRFKHLSLDLQEGRLYLQDKNATAKDICDALYEDFGSEYIIVTQGKNGLYLRKHELVTKTNRARIYNAWQCDGQKPLDEIELPAFDQTKVKDTMGCGDSVFAISALMISIFSDPNLIALCGNLAGWMHAQVEGNMEALSKEKFFEHLKMFVS